MPTTAKVIGMHMWNFKPNFKCSPLKFWGDPRPGLWCVLASLGQCLACVKIWGAGAPRGRNIVFRKKSSWVGQHVNMRAYNCLVSGPKFARFFSPNRGWNVVDQALFGFLIYRSIPGIFWRSNSKVVKNHIEFWTFFTLPNSVGGTPCVSTWSPRLWATSAGKILW